MTIETTQAPAKENANSPQNGIAQPTGSVAESHQLPQDQLHPDLRDSLNGKLSES